MSKSIHSFPIRRPLLLLMMIISGGTLKLANAQRKTWCVANPSASDAELDANIRTACNQLRERCKIIEQGGLCYSPNTLINHASVAMNLYYQLKGRNTWNCDFGASGLTTITDPSYRSCHYA